MRWFEVLTLLIFIAFGLKMPLHAPKMDFLGDLAAEMSSIINNTPKRLIRQEIHVIQDIGR